MIVLSSIIDTFKDLFLSKYRSVLLPSQKKALSAMELCRTSSAPQMMACCTNNECSHSVCMFLIPAVIETAPIAKTMNHSNGSILN